jgi:hypothetical protein
MTDIFILETIKKMQVVGRKVAACCPSFRILTQSGAVSQKTADDRIVSQGLETK